MKKPAKKLPRTREHTARFISRDPMSIEVSLQESPVKLLQWASNILARFDSAPGNELFLNLLEGTGGDPDLQDIAWCAVHGRFAIELLAKIPANDRKNAILACIHMFQAGKRHESSDEYRKHGAAIDEKKRRIQKLAGATTKSAEQRRVIKVDDFNRIYRPGMTNEELARIFGVSPQGMGKWRRKNGR